MGIVAALTKASDMSGPEFDRPDLVAGSVLAPWGVAALVLLILGFDDWDAKGGLWHVLMLVALSLVALHVLAAVALRWRSWLRPSDVRWIDDKVLFLKRAALVGSGLALLLTVDLLGARWVLKPSELDIPVVRTLCKGAAGRPDVPVQQGQVCFTALVGADHDHFSTRDVWRVDQEKLGRDVPVGGMATLRMRHVAQAWLPLGGYTQVMTVR